MSAQVGRVLGGRYRLVAPIGIGASAEVYLADDVELERQVAVKLLHEVLVSEGNFLRRFQAEARAAAALNHPNIVAIHDVGADGAPYLVTEYLAGGSLRTVLDRGSGLTVAQASQVGVQAGRGLAHAHGAGIVHRDIKPANLLFDLDGRLRVGDFGLARALAEAALTELDGSPLGTARYACPEQVRGEPVGPTGDVYALALVLIEAVSGAAPFGSDTTLASLLRRTEEPIPVPPELAALTPVLEAAGRTDPAQRPTATEFTTALLSVSEPLDPAAPVDVTGASTIVVGDPTISAPLASVAADPANRVESVEPARQSPTLFDQDVAEITPLPALDTSAEVDDEFDDASNGGRTRRRRWPFLLLGVLVLAAVGLGAGYLASQPTTHPVPQLVGQSVDDLESLIGDYDWDIAEEQTRADGTIAGEILAQDPAAGAELAEGDELLLTVSIGPSLVEVPTDLVGQPLGEATAQLESVGLTVGDVERRYDEDAALDIVLAVDETLVGAGEAPKGSAVPLVVSDGPAPRPVPDVVGLSWDEVVAAFGDVGLTPLRVDEASREVAAGLAMSSDPGTGTEVARGSEVVVQVSNGPPWIVLRDVSGLTPAEAADLLEGDRLVVAGVTGPPNRPVTSTDPPAGTSVQEGSSVGIVTSG